MAEGSYGAPLRGPSDQSAKNVDGSTRVSDDGRGYRDWPFAVAFILQVIIVFVLGVVFYSNNKDKIGSDNARDSVELDYTRHMGVLLGTFIAGGMVAAAMFCLIIKAYAKALVWFTLLLSVAALGVFTLLALVAGQVPLAVISLIMLALNLLYIYLVRKRIAFAVATLEIVSSFVKDYPATVAVAYGGVIVQLVWIVIWTVTAVFAMYDSEKTAEERSRGEEDEPSGGKWFLLLVCLYWTSTVIKNVVHVTAAGSFAAWYYFFPQFKTPNPTKAALGRALTTSFGSICFGSLLIAIVKAIRDMARAARRQNDSAAMFIAECLIRCAEWLIQYFNMYAFSYVAIYGDSFCEAAKKTWDLIKSRGLSMIINDDLTGGVLFLGSIFGGLLNGVFAFMLTRFAYEFPTGLIVFWVVVAVLFGFVLCTSALSICQSCVVTLFIAFFEDPDALQSTKTEEYSKLSSAWGQRYSDVPIPHGAYSYASHSAAGAQSRV